MASVRKHTMHDPDAWVSLTAASQMLKESRQFILARAIKGDLDAQHIAGRTVISRASIERVLSDKVA